jgi:hypothetical protein
MSDPRSPSPPPISPTNNPPARLPPPNLQNVFAQYPNLEVDDEQFDPYHQSHYQDNLFQVKSRSFSEKPNGIFPHNNFKEAESKKKRIKFKETELYRDLISEQTKQIMGKLGSFVEEEDEDGAILENRPPVALENGAIYIGSFKINF